MSLEEFINKWDGRILDFDGAYGGQCVDLYRQYLKDILGVPQSPPVVGAADIWDSYRKEDFDRVSNTPSAVPASGNIIIWGRSYGPFGHVAVFVDGNVNKFRAFSQNDPIGAKCGIRQYSYNHILGWLTPKQSIINQPVIDDKTKIDLGEGWGLMEVQAIRSSLNDMRRDIESLRGTVVTFTKVTKEQDEKINNLTTELAAAREGLQIISKEREGLIKKIEKLEEGLRPFNNPISRLLYSIAVSLEA